jgi:hypothetical protein
MKIINFTKIVFATVFLLLTCHSFAMTGTATQKVTDSLPPADKILEAIAAGNFATLAKYVHPQRGLEFSPYSRNLIDLQTIRFSQAEVVKFGVDERIYTWGTFDGSGEPILMTPSDYFKEFVYDIDYIRKAKRTTTIPKQRTPGEFSGLHKYYPEELIVRYHYPGTPDNEYIDFRDLILLFSVIEGRWYLVGVALAESTV